MFVSLRPVPARITVAVDRAEELGPPPDPATVDYLSHRAAYVLHEGTDAAHTAAGLLAERRPNEAAEVLDDALGYLSEYLRVTVQLGNAAAPIAPA